MPLDVCFSTAIKSVRNFIRMASVRLQQRDGSLFAGLMEPSDSKTGDFFTQLLLTI